MTDPAPETRPIKLTKREVDALAPRATRFVAWDSEVRRFGVRVQPSGQRSYVLKYRHGGEQKWFVIGTHGSPWTPEMARKEALKLLGDVARGDDPAQAKSDNRKAITVSELCDLYLLEGVGHKKPKTIKADTGRIEHHLKPLLGSKVVRLLTRADVERLQVDVVRGKTAVAREKKVAGSVPKGGAGVGAQCVTLMGTLLAFAVRRGLRPDNPAHGIKKPPVRKMQRFLTSAEIGKLGAALRDETERAPFDCAAIGLLLLTGCRKSEILTLEWRHVDIERALLFLPDSKTREKTVFLNAPAVKILKRIPRVDDNPFVIAGLRSGRHSMALDKVWARVRTAAGLSDVRLHDLRHSFASVGAGASLGLPVIGKLLGHTQASTTMRYSHLHDDPLRKAANTIGATISAAMEPQKRSAPTRGRVV